MVTKCRDDELQGPNVPKLPHQEIRIHLLTLHSPRKNNDDFYCRFTFRERSRHGGRSEKKIFFEVGFGIFFFFLMQGFLMEIFTEGITFLNLPIPAPCAENEFVNIKKKPRNRFQGIDSARLRIDSGTP